MRVITPSELAGRPDSELSALFREAAQALTCSELNSQEEREALATLENIKRERTLRGLPSCPGR